ncbi:MAG: hypothetical protein LDL33_12570 [Desulfomonile sp.]|nr:hypothetical protein [Desulfomonile sp.]
MRTVMIVIVVIGAVIFLGGTVNIGGAPLFAHIDAMLNTELFMDLHDGLFGFMQRGGGRAGDSMHRMGEEIDKFRQKPLGIDHGKKYRQLDDAAGN